MFFSLAGQLFFSSGQRKKNHQKSRKIRNSRTVPVYALYINIVLRLNLISGLFIYFYSIFGRESVTYLVISLAQFSVVKNVLEYRGVRTVRTLLTMDARLNFFSGKHVLRSQHLGFVMDVSQADPLIHVNPDFSSDGIDYYSRTGQITALAMEPHSTVSAITNGDLEYHSVADEITRLDEPSLRNDGWIRVWWEF